jgi:uncharacterized protein YukE
MNVFVDAARLIINLGSLGEQFKGVGGSSFGGEYLASSVTSMGADALSGGLVGYKMVQQYRLGQNMTPAERAEMNNGMKDATSLILKTLTVVDLAELLTGFGPPCAGEDFTAGSQQLTEISEQLKSALPDDDWQGSASEAYAQQVTALRAVAQAIAELDLQLADITKNQAEWVTHMRLGFGILKDLLMAAFAIELALKLSVPQPAGLALAQTFATTVAFLGIAAASSFVLTLFYYAQENADKANELISKYQKLAPSAVSADSTPAGTAVATATKSTVSDFGDVSRKLADVSSGVDVATTVRPDASAKQSTPTGAGETSRGRHVLEESDEKAPSNGTPTLAPVTQIPRHAAQLNQMMGPIRQSAPTAPQGQKAAVPAEEAEFADDVDGDGAARGSVGAERAPIEVAAIGRHADVPPGLARRAG